MGACPLTLHRLPGSRSFVRVASLLGMVLLAACNSAAEAPPPLAAPTLVPVAVLPTATPPPTETPLEVAATVTITITAPADGDTVDMGQPLTLVVEASAPSGVRQVTFTSNGQNVGQARGMDQTTVRVEQPWTPTYAGTHHVVATLGDREGNVVASEPLLLRVVDREMITANAPLWDAVETNVTAMRGLVKQEPIVPSILSRTELRQRLRAESFYTEEDARRDVLVYSAFDFMRRNFDLYTLTRRYMGDSLAGFYDPATKEFVVVSDDAQMNALEQWVYAHEFMHALQDQHFDLALITDTTLSFDGNMAVRALAEGEAELLQEQYIEQGYLSDDQLVEIFNLITRRRQSGGIEFPRILSTSFLFPYETGLEFTRALYDRGGWPALNQAWQNPPRSTEQILHPDRFLAGDAPQLVALAPLTGTLGASYELLETDVFGEFLLREYLGQQLSAGDVDVAATGWGGDSFAVYWNDDTQSQVMLLRTVWDSAADAGEFATAYAAYATRLFATTAQIDTPTGICWQATDVLCLFLRAPETLVVRAPDVATAQAVAANQ
jgi:hypothetical protein